MGQVNNHGPAREPTGAHVSRGTAGPAAPTAHTAAMPGVYVRPDAISGRHDFAVRTQNAHGVLARAALE